MIRFLDPDHIEVVEVLIANKTDINSADKQRSPLFCAVDGGKCVETEIRPKIFWNLHSYSRSYENHRHAFRTQCKGQCERQNGEYATPLRRHER